MTALASNKRRFKCPVCERSVDRQSRQQQFCSPRCRSRAFREKTHPMTGCTGSVTDPPKISNENNILQWPKSRSSTRFKNGICGPRKVIDFELIAGRSWQEVVSSNGVKSYVSRLVQRALAP
jgi:hypothetical protein